MKQSVRRRAIVALCMSLPMLMGGCPEFRDQSLTAIESASQGVLLAALDLFFDQLRSDQSN